MSRWGVVWIEWEKKMTKNLIPPSLLRVGKTKRSWSWQEKSVLLFIFFSFFQIISFPPPVILGYVHPSNKKKDGSAFLFVPFNPHFILPLMSHEIAIKSLSAIPHNGCLALECLISLLRAAFEKETNQTMPSKCRGRGPLRLWLSILSCYSNIYRTLVDFSQ